MRIIIKNYFFMCSLVISLFWLNAAWALTESPAGTWITIDNKTHKPRALLSLKESNGILYGKIIKVFKEPGDTGICSKCPGSFKNKRITGLTVLWGLKNKSKNLWTGGQVLDPKTGRIYSCKIQVLKNGKNLKVRAYVGVSLLGRTQTWIRKDSNHAR